MKRFTVAPGSAVPLSVGAVGVVVSIVTASGAVAMLSTPPLVRVEL
jgi:hypothetical protein